MARPREFDTEEALLRAMRVFWAKGYEATSVDDLCDATGLNRSSLYGTFGDKRALYLQALDRYERDGVTHIAATLARPPIKTAFESFVGRFVDDIVAGPGRRGCFIGNCAVELTRLDRGVAAHVGKSLRRIEATFCEAIEAAKARGELRADSDVVGIARFLTAGIQGLRLVGKANHDRATLEDVARLMLRCLDQ
jgi:TetR/AcrR family transcriptional repressor of nem operon